MLCGEEQDSGAQTRAMPPFVNLKEHSSGLGNRAATTVQLPTCCRDRGLRGTPQICTVALGCDLHTFACPSEHDRMMASTRVDAALL